MTRVPAHPPISGLAVILGDSPEISLYARSLSGPPSSLPITWWYPAWWGISPWASPYWKVTLLCDCGDREPGTPCDSHCSRRSTQLAAPEPGIPPAAD
jgi:hypothetical protein